MSTIITKEKGGIIFEDCCTDMKTRFVEEKKLYLYIEVETDYGIGEPSGTTIALDEQASRELLAYLKERLDND